MWAALRAGLPRRAASGRRLTELVQQAVPRNLTPQQWAKAQEFVQGGATADEALNAVTGGGARHMSSIMRVAANSPEGAAVTDPFYAQRAQRNIAQASR